MSTELQPIEVFACPITELRKLRPTLNRLAADGYAPLCATYVPSKEGGMLVYVLGDVSQVGPAREIEEPEDDAARDLPAEESESPGDSEPVAAKVETTVTLVPPHSNGSGAHSSDPHGAAGEGAA